jgi:sulfate permease, SulP family
VVITTFAATLFLPAAAAVGIGVALSLLLQLNQDAMDLAIVELIPRDDGRFEERPAPATLTQQAYLDAEAWLVKRHGG